METEPTLVWSDRGGYVMALRERIAELEAQLAAVPKWTRITNDPATWPPDTKDMIMVYTPDFREMEILITWAWAYRNLCQAISDSEVGWLDGKEYWHPFILSEED